MLYAIGSPGQVPRTFLGSPDPRDIGPEVQPGEVAIPVAEFARGIIGEDGLSFVVLPPSIDELRAETWQRAKDIRASREAGGCLVPGIGWVQTGTLPPYDGESRIAIEAGRAGRALAADPETAWSIEFRMADNSVRTTSAVDMIAMDDAVQAHVQACRAAANTIRDLIATAPDEAALAAIDLTDGYPPLPA